MPRFLFWVDTLLHRSCLPAAELFAISSKDGVREGFCHRLNARSYSREPGIVEVGVVKMRQYRADGVRWRLHARDDGLTLSEKEQENRKLFEESLKNMTKTCVIQAWTTIRGIDEQRPRKQAQDRVSKALRRHAP
jgi:hypothetical protein